MIQLINRRIYTERIAPFINKSIIKVLTGQRRVGKSCILRQIQNHIEQTQPDCNIICINKELEEFAFMRSHEEKPREIHTCWWTFLCCEPIYASYYATCGQLSWKKEPIGGLSIW